MKTNLRRDRGWKRHMTNGIVRFEIWGDKALQAVRSILTRLSGAEVSYKRDRMVIKVPQSNRTVCQRLTKELTRVPTSA